MENYKNARDLLKKHLFDKLTCERFGWEIRVGKEHFIVDAALTVEENEDKIAIVEEIIRHMLYELDTYLFHIEVDHEYQNIPTIFHLLQMSIEFDDTPINPDDVFEVDESTINRRHNAEDENLEIKDVIRKFVHQDYPDKNFPVWMTDSVVKACEKLAEHDRGDENVLEKT